MIKSITTMADERYDFRTICPGWSRRTESSKRVIQEKKKRELLDYLNVTDCNEEFSSSNRLWRIRGEGEKVAQTGNTITVHYMTQL